MHAKTDSEGTSLDGATVWLPRSPPRGSSRPVYYVQSPSNHDALEKMSYGSASPLGSPPHPAFYHCSPIHHSRESSTSRFSDSLKPVRGGYYYKNLQHVGGFEPQDEEDDEEMEEWDRNSGFLRGFRLYACLFLLFIVLFTLFSLVLWGASKSYKPKIHVKGIVFENLNLQAGNDRSGVPTDMLSLNSTVRMLYRNPATFFTVHVTSTPFQLHYFQLELAAGQMKKFKQSRKSQRTVVTVVQGHQIPLYGGVPLLLTEREHIERIALPLNLTFVIRSRAYILGRLVKSKFYSRIRCSVILHGDKLGEHLRLSNACTYQ